MNAFVIVGRRHGSEKLEQIGGLIEGAEIAREKFMAYRTKQKDPDFQTVGLYSLSDERLERFTPEAASEKTKATTHHTKGKQSHEN